MTWCALLTFVSGLLLLQGVRVGSICTNNSEFQFLYYCVHVYSTPSIVCDSRGSGGTLFLSVIWWQSLFHTHTLTHTHRINEENWPQVVLITVMMFIQLWVRWGFIILLYHNIIVAYSCHYCVIIIILCVIIAQLSCYETLSSARVSFLTYI